MQSNHGRVLFGCTAAPKQTFCLSAACSRKLKHVSVRHRLSHTYTTIAACLHSVKAYNAQHSMPGIHSVRYVAAILPKFLHNTRAPHRGCCGGATPLLAPQLLGSVFKSVLLPPVAAAYAVGAVWLAGSCDC